MIAGFQANRLNDQRATLPNLPGLQKNEAVIGQLLASSNQQAGQGAGLDDSFLEMLMRCQVGSFSVLHL